MAEIDEVAKAKADLEAIGQQWNTICDAYRITNLAAQRNGWKVIQKTSGEHCQSRKVDGIIIDGQAYDCLVNAGPPSNANTPAWQYMGPQNALIAIDPLHDPIDDNTPEPPDPPDPIPPDTDLEKRVIVLEAQMNQVLEFIKDFNDSDFAVVLPVEQLTKSHK